MMVIAKTWVLPCCAMVVLMSTLALSGCSALVKCAALPHNQCEFH